MEDLKMFKEQRNQSGNKHMRRSYPSANGKRKGKKMI
jgi:hypothetical protein